MASKGTAFVDGKGAMHKVPVEATLSDLAAALGRIGEGEGLTLGVAKKVMDSRAEIERIWAEHDEMCADSAPLPSVGVMYA